MELDDDEDVLDLPGSAPHDRWMRLALEEARAAAAEDEVPVGAIVVAGGRVIASAHNQRERLADPTAHAEMIALTQAAAAVGSWRLEGCTLYVTLEPCSHHGRTPPCAEAVIAAGVRRVVVGVGDPDSKVAGRGLEMLRSAGIDVTVGVRSDAINEQLAPYLHHRRTGRPYVVAKVGMSLDGGTAAPDGTSQWITGEPARADAHRLRAESGAIVVGAGTVRADNPSLTVRHVQGPDPLRVVLGQAPEGARVHPCVEWSGSLEGLLDDLGSRGILQVLVEGGATVLRAFRDSDLIDRYVAYVAPSILGGSDKAPMIAGPSVSTIAGLERGRFAGVRLVGEDLRIDLIPPRRDPA